MTESGNSFFDVAVRIGREMAERERKVVEKERKGQIVPFGQEKVSAEGLRRRLLPNPERLEEGKALREWMLGRPGGREAMLRLFSKEKKP